MEPLHRCVWPRSALFWPQGRHSLALLVIGAKKKRRKPEPILLRDRPTSACLPSALPAPPSLPPTATTTAALAAPAAPVYTMPRVFGPFPVLPSESVSGCILTPLLRSTLGALLCPQQWLSELCI